MKTLNKLTVIAVLAFVFFSCEVDPISDEFDTENFTIEVLQGNEQTENDTQRTDDEEDFPDPRGNTDTQRTDDEEDFPDPRGNTDTQRTDDEEDFPDPRGNSGN